MVAVLICNQVPGGRPAAWIADPMTRAESTRDSIICRRFVSV